MLKLVNGCSRDFKTTSSSEMDVLMRICFSLLILVASLMQSSLCHARTEVIYAINAGGEAHTDVHGIRYSRDPLTDKDIGTASDFGKNLIIARVPPADQILYQTERYHHATFGYDLPLRGDGNYVLVLKFAEVYFNAPDQKVFNVHLNGVPVITELDIFAQVGRGVAHQEIVAFSVADSRHITFSDGTKTSLTQPSSLRVDFIKGLRDNPKINAVYLIRGTSQDVPPLPPFPLEEEPELLPEEEAQPSLSGQTARKVSSGPRTPDPYNSDESTGTFLPLVAAVGAAIPIVFCLCRM
ncbi:Malectin [Trinorchestia longiramus]|nr:Malectin [Trinorchestia longiramus]